MDLNRVSLFIQVVESGSFTRAAGTLGMTTSGVSRALTRLEEDLGVRLIQRTTRKLSLTASGRSYFEDVRGALAAVDEASTRATEMGEEPRGIIRLTAPPALISSLIPALAEFLRRYPKIHLELSGSQGVVDLVEHGLDLAVRVGRLGDSSLIARRVGKLVTGLFASREYVQRCGRPRKLGDLAEHNCLLFRSNGPTDTWRLSDGGREYRVEVSGSLEVDEITSLHQAILAGLGIGSMSFYMSSRVGGLIRILPRYVTNELPVSLVSPSKRLEPARVVLLRDFLATRLSFRPKRN